ncbi:MAG TPA: hypothetical protein VGM88_04195 [Kofleriaceae bacterium]|jgi:hypothetical protein
MTTIDLSILDAVTGGATQAQNVCNRSQYDWMLAHMVPDSGLKPGVQRHVVLQDSKTCGFPFPKGR